MSPPCVSNGGGEAARGAYRERANIFLRSALVASTFAVLFTTICNSGLGYAYWVAAAHFFQHVQVGESTSLIACLSVICLLAAQPFATSILVRLPRLDPARRAVVTYAGALATSTIAGVFAIGTVFVLPHVIPSLRVIDSPLLGGFFIVGTVFGSVGLVLDAASIALRSGRVMSVRNVAMSFGKLLILVVFALSTAASGPTLVLVSWCAMAVVATAWGAWKLVGINGAGWPTEWRPGWHGARAGYSAQLLATVGGAIPTQLLPVLVAARLGPSAAAYFSLTWLLGGVFFIISPAVCQALLAEGSYDPDALRHRTISALALIAGLLIPTAVILALGGHRILSLFGHDYASHGYRLLLILAVSTIPDAITNVAVSTLRVREYLREGAAINMLIGGVAVALTWILLPAYGIAGAGEAWLFAQVAGCLLYVALLLRSRHRAATVPILEATAETGHG